MRILFFYILFLSLAPATYGQLQIVPIAETKKNPSNKAVLTLPFWDDFSASADSPDTTMWLYGNTVYVNATVAHNPPTYKTATFDGLKGDGQAYNIAEFLPGKTDSLVSHPIDMTNAERATTFISFYWQARGNGEVPDDSDSIRLQLKSSDNGVEAWKTIWAEVGGLESFDFKQEIIQISDPTFFHDSLQLKFESYGSLNGQFDSWNIDYIYLNDGRSVTDFNYFDRALSGSPSPLFGLYTQIPFAHLISEDSLKYNSQSLFASNLSGSDFPLVYRHILRNETLNIEYSNELISSGLIKSLEKSYLLDSIFSPLVTVELSDFQNQPDSQVIASTFIFFSEDEESGVDNSPGRDLEINDTIRTEYLLHDQYAYDDGSAEFAAGINLRSGQLAVRFIAKSKDTLTHLSIHFPDIAPDANGTPIELIIWGDDLDQERIRQPYTVSKTAGLNVFNEIKLDNPIIVSDTFHIGFQQLSDDFISIGFDRNNPMATSTIFSNTTGQWQQNERLIGALMIRPVFKRDTSVILNTTKNLLINKISIYPVPASDFLKIEGNYRHIEIFNLSGKLMYHSSNKSTHSLTGLNKGLFLVKIYIDDQCVSRKLIIE